MMARKWRSPKFPKVAQDAAPTKHDPATGQFTGPGGGGGAAPAPAAAPAAAAGAGKKKAPASKVDKAWKHINRDPTGNRMDDAREFEPEDFSNRYDLSPEEAVELAARVRKANYG